MRINRKLRTTFFSMVCGILILMALLAGPTMFVRGNISNTFNFTQNYQFIEYADETDNLTNVNASINLNLPGSEWNVSGIELNFTDISLGREVVEVETESSGGQLLDKKPNGYAVQFNTTEATLLYAVEIYGDVDTYATTTNLTIEIQGYDTGTDKPNGTVYGVVDLNLTTTRQWYLQEFPSAIPLPAGKFFIVMNGSLMSALDPAKYYWYYNDNSNKTLWTWEYDNGWKNGLTTQPFLYKLHQKVDRSYNPEEIEMQAVINGIAHNVTDGAPGEGNLTVISNFNSGSSVLDIPILTNQTIELTFNLTYHLDCQKTFKSDGTLTLEPDVDNIWVITPDINRVFDNYTIQFDIPIGWSNVEVYRNSLNITGQTNKIGNSLYIPNASITIGSNWEIRAKSSDIDFTVNIPITDLGPDEKLTITVNPPNSQGNVTFTLIDPTEFVEFQQSESAASEVSFDYTFGTKPREGTWTAVICWNNGTQGGITVQDITVTVPFTIDPQVLFMIIIIIAVAAVIGTTTYTTVKKVKRKRATYRQKIFDKYMDTLNLNHLIIADKKSGLNIYEEYFAGKEIDPTLIAGFLNAIRSFGLELTDSENKSQTIKLDYKDSKILMVEFKGFRLIFIMNDIPSSIFVDSVRSLVQDIEEHYGKYLVKFTGDKSKFTGIRDLIEKNLQTPLLYPLKVVKLEKIKISSEEKGIMNRALRYMKKTNTNRFFVSNVLTQKKTFEAKDAELILKLINKKIFQPDYNI